MTTKELQKTIREKLRTNRRYELIVLCSRIPTVYMTSPGSFSSIPSDAVRDEDGSILNAYLQCDDGYIPHPIA